MSESLFIEACFVYENEEQFIKLQTEVGSLSMSVILNSTNLDLLQYDLTNAE